MKMHISKEWLRKKIREDGDVDVEAGMPVDLPVLMAAHSAMGKRLSDDPILVEMRSIPYLPIDEHDEKIVDGMVARQLAHVRDDPGLAEMKRMEDLKSKAPCLARLDALAAWSAKDDES